ncbi:MAG: pilin [Thiobacillaceae bacterium]|nr:pilin [Thiobacillaceae bacterium]
MSEGLSLASAAKQAVSEHYLTRNSFPSNNASAGLPAAASIKGDAVRSVQVAGGLITITFRTNVQDGGTLLLSPTATASGVQWKCKPGTSNPLNAKFLPSNCRS